MQGIDVALSDARDTGVAHLAEIAEHEAAGKGLTVPQCLTYLRDNLHFYLGTHERAGLARFHQLATELNLASPGVAIGFDHCTSAR